MQSKPEFDAIFDAMLSPVLVIDTDFIIITCNKSYESLVNTQREYITGEPLFKVLSSGNAEQDNALQKSFRNAITSRQPHRIPFIQYNVPGTGEGRSPNQTHKSTERFWAVVNTPVLSADGSVQYILNQPSDITQIVQSRDINLPLLLGTEISPEQFDQHISFLDLLYQERTRIHEIFHQAPGFACILSGRNYIFEMANQAYIDVFAQSDVIGKPLREAIPKVKEQGILALLDQVCSTGEPFSAKAMEFLVYPDDASEPRQIFIDFIYQPICDNQGEVTGVFVQGYEVTEAYNLTQAVSYQAAHDPLTGLYNRREVHKRSEPLEKDSGPHALLYIDLDHFKIVNDHCGHTAGDELLVELSSKLESTISDHLLARIGGDEFLVIMENSNATEAVTLAETISQVVTSIVFYWKNQRYGITASIGVAEFGREQGIGFGDALSHADSACFLAKDKGRDRIQVYRVDDDDVYQQLKDMD